MKTNRREFIGTGLAIAGTLTTSIPSFSDEPDKSGTLTKHILPQLS